MTRTKEMYTTKSGLLAFVSEPGDTPCSMQITDRDGEWLDVEKHGSELVFRTGGPGPMPSPIVPPEDFEQVYDLFKRRCL